MKRKKVAQPSPIVPQPTVAVNDLADFQTAYGNDWANILGHPAMRSAMFVLNKRKLNSLLNISNEMIEKNGREILAGLRDHLQYENDLFTLHTKQEAESVYEGEEDYYSPEQIAEFEILKEKFKKDTERKRYG